MSNRSSVITDHTRNVCFVISHVFNQIIKLFCIMVTILFIVWVIMTMCKVVLYRSLTPSSSIEYPLM